MRASAGGRLRAEGVRSGAGLARTREDGIGHATVVGCERLIGRACDHADLALPTPHQGEEHIVGLVDRQAGALTRSMKAFIAFCDSGVQTPSTAPT